MKMTENMEKKLKKDIRLLLKKTTILNFSNGLFYMLFLLYAAYILSEIMSNIQTGLLENAISEIIKLILSWLLYGALVWLLKRCILSVQTREKMKVREYFISRILHIPYMRKESAGTVLENVSNDINRIIDHFGNRRADAAVAMISCLLYFGVAVYTSPWVSLCMALLACLEILPHMAVKHFFMKKYLDCREIETAITDILVEGYKGAEEIKVYRALPWLDARLYRKHKEYEKIGMKSEIAFTGETMLSSFIKQVINYGFYILLGLFFGCKIITMSEAAILGVLAGDFFAKMDLLFQMIPEFMSDKAAFQRIMKWDRDMAQAKETEKGSGSGEGDRIRIEDFSLCYGKKKILQNFSADISLKKRTVIVGENGSGKTSFLRFLAGISEEGTGTLRMRQGEEYRAVTGIEAAWLPQECPALVFSAEELVRPENWKRFRENSEKMGLEEGCLYTPLNQLSGGQRKKIYLSVIFCTHSRLLLLDEPANDLDETGKRALMDLMINFPKGILYVTHDPELMEIAEETIHMDSAFRAGMPAAAE